MSVSSLKAELKSLGYDLKKIKVKEKSCSCTVIVRDPSINLSTIKDITMRHNQDLSMMVRFDYTLLEAETRNFLREAELLYEVYQNTPPGKREPVYNLAYFLRLAISAAMSTPCFSLSILIASVSVRRLATCFTSCLAKWSAVSNFMVPPVPFAFIS